MTQAQEVEQEAAQALPPIQVPATVTREWVLDLQQQLDRVSRSGVTALKAVLTQQAVKALLERCEVLFKADPTLIEVRGPESGGVPAMGPGGRGGRAAPRPQALWGNARKRCGATHASAALPLAD